jgi:hypothetical protein
MNKAFVRESDSTDVLCPACGAVGEPTPRETLAAHLSEAQRSKLADAALFCPTGTCPVAYFDAFEGAIRADDLASPVYPKDPDAPICACFRFTTDEIEEDLAEGTPRRIRELLAKSKSPAAHCATASPTGRNCMPEVQRYYFRRKAELERE